MRVLSASCLPRVATLTLVLASPGASPAADFTISGRVLGPDGVPRSKTEVRLEPVPSTYELARLRLMGRPTPGLVDRTLTGFDGTFELAAPEAGIWQVVVATPGMLPVEYRLIPLIGPTVVPPVELAPAKELKVLLLDAEGNPRPGAVGALALDCRSDAWCTRPRLATAGEDGVARLPRGRDEMIQLEVLAEDHPLIIREVKTESSMAIKVPSGIAGTVRVIDRRKQPIAEAVIFQESGLLPLGLSDSEGRLSLRLQGNQPRALNVIAADRSNGSFEINFGAASEKKETELRLEPPLTIHGSVIDLAKRDPVPAALVWAIPGELATTDEHGRYFLDVGSGTYRQVQAAAIGYQTGQGTIWEAGAGATATIGLSPAATLSGKVVLKDASSPPVVSIQIVPRGVHPPPAQHGTFSGWLGQTTHRGTFRLAGLPTGVWFQVTFTASGLAPKSLAVEPLGQFETRSGIEVVMRPGRIAEGRVVDDNDSPVAGAEIRLEASPASDGPGAHQEIMNALANSILCSSDAEGHFEIADLATGRYDLEVRANGFAPARIPGVSVAEGDGVADFGTVALVPGASVEGRVAAPDDTAISGAEVTIKPQYKGFTRTATSELRYRAKTDGRGRFAIPDLTPGQPVDLEVTKVGYASATVNALRPPTGEALAIVLRPAGRILGRVVDKSGDPIPEATVQTHVDDRVAVAAMWPGSSSSTRSGTDGRFAFESVEPGVLSVTADAEGYCQGMLQGIELASGCEVEIVLELEAGAVVEGTVITADGKPLVRATISVAEKHEAPLSDHHVTTTADQTDADGRYRVTGAATGAATIVVYHQNAQRLTDSIEVKPGVNVVNLVLDHDFEISGQVVDPTGAPVHGATVVIQAVSRPGSRFYRGLGSPQATTANGTFILSGVPAGKYMVTASSQGYTPARSETFEVSGDVTGVLLELGQGVTLKGNVRGFEYGELGSLSLIAFNNNRSRRLGFVDISSRYTFTNLEPGIWKIDALATSSGRSARTQVEIPKGAAEVEEDLVFFASAPPLN